MTDTHETIIGIPINLSRGNCPHCGKEIRVKLEAPRTDKPAPVTPIISTPRRSE